MSIIEAIARESNFASAYFMSYACVYGTNYQMLIHIIRSSHKEKPNLTHDDYQDFCGIFLKIFFI
jgi:hypothetical protein